MIRTHIASRIARRHLCLHKSELGTSCATAISLKNGMRKTQWYALSSCDVCVWFIRMKMLTYPSRKIFYGHHNLQIVLLQLINHTGLNQNSNQHCHDYSQINPNTQSTDHRHITTTVTVLYTGHGTVSTDLWLMTNWSKCNGIFDQDHEFGTFRWHVHWTLFLKRTSKTKINWRCVCV